MLNRGQAVLSVTFLALSSVAVTAIASTLEGKVFGPDGQPIKGADIRLESSSPAFAGARTKTDVRGQYRFSNVAAGTYKVSVFSANVMQRFISNVMLEGNKRVDLKISPASSAAQTKRKHRVWVPPPTGTYIGGKWKEVDDTAPALTAFSKIGLDNIGAASTAVSRDGSRASVIGGTQGAFKATQIGTKPAPH